MSLLAKARENGPDYIYSIVTGDNANIPAGLTLPPGKYYDPYIAGDLTPYWHGDPNRVPRGGLISMPPPLAPGKVQFDDGTRSSVSEEAWDVAAFLEWAADPKMEQRKELGVSVLIFLVLFSGLLWVTYRNLWRDIGH
jgi:ubiquinol-cytochrome c reductase cytochrome c1 subunit